MLSIKSIEIKNLASFDMTDTSVNGFNQLNVIIGRNNQGKSNFLKAIQFLDYNNLISFLDELPDSYKKLNDYRTIVSNREMNSIFHYKSREKMKPIEISYVLEIDKKRHTYSIKIPYLLNKNDGKYICVGENGKRMRTENPVLTLFDNKEITINEVLGNPKKIVHSIVSTMNYDFETLKETLLKMEFEEKQEKVKNLLKKIYHLSPDFHELSGPLWGDHILPNKFEGRHYKEVDKEIYEEKLYLNLVFLLDKPGLYSESLGSGQKQTLALISEIEMAVLNNAPIITIDEMELHLYPALQKRVLKEIKDIYNNHQFFISTHSNILISTPLDQRIFFIQKIKDSTQIDPRKTTFELFEILDDLGVKASDILQSNGVIWVEGPSDKIIFQNWLKKIGVSESDLNQISFVFYGGSLISHIKFPELLKLNRNCVVIQDSDKKSKDDELGPQKILVEEECKNIDIYCWTLNVREIENYFPLDSIIKYIENYTRREIKDPLIFNDYTNIEEIIFNYRQSKPRNARRILNYITKNDILNNKELYTNLIKIKKMIQAWNKL